MTKRFAYTDYPFISLRDIPGELAPVRRCEVLTYDGNKYCLIRVYGRIEEVKSDYLYMTASRIQSSRPFPRRWLKWLPWYETRSEWIATQERVRKLLLQGP